MQFWENFGILHAGLILAFAFGLVTLLRLLMRRIKMVKDEYGDKKVPSGEYFGRSWGEIFAIILLVVSFVVLWTNVNPNHAAFSIDLPKDETILKR